MDGLETLREALDRLTIEGYTQGFSAQEGKLHLDGNGSFDASEFSVDAVVRFEGITDVDEESAVFALTHKATGLKGVYVVAYGPEMSTDDLAVVQKLAER